jgi:phosphate transport system substrate-binding protein
MGHFRNWAGLLSLLLLASNLAFAQGSDSVQVIGSGIVNSLVETLAEASGHSSLKIETVGSATGIDRFCNGGIDLATAIRAMTAAERAICGANDVAFSEFLLSHYISAFVAHPDAPLECLSANELNEALKPSASNRAADWSFYDAEMTDLSLTLFRPRDNRIDYLILDSLVAGDGLRKDVEVYEDPAAAAAEISETAGALGFVPWSRELESNQSVAILEFSGDDSGECAGASVESVEDGRYGAALSLYLIVNRARLKANESFLDFMRFILDESSASSIADAGIRPPSEATYKLNERVLADEAAARAAAAEFQVPEVLSGSLKLVGAASAVDVLDRVADSLSQDDGGLEITLDFLGRGNGLAKLCAGEADIAVLDVDLAEGDLEACANSAIAATPVKLGTQATVLLGNAADDYAACLTAEQIVTIWSAKSAESPNEWSNVDPAFPAARMTLFGLSVLDQHTDILLQTAGQVIPPIRRDTETDFDPLYRAAAVSNVPGALTYMNWHEYQRVVNNNQANIQLVAVDAGAGCVTPSPTSIQDSSYALSRPATLLIRQESLADINTQSYLWTLFSAGSRSILEREGFVNLSELELAGLRREMRSWFAEAEAMYPPVDAEDDASDAASE